jgi:hypothetical protein
MAAMSSRFVLSNEEIMRFVRFDTIDDQGNKVRDIYVNPELVRSVTSMQPYGKNQRCRLAFAMDDAVLIGISAEEAQRKLHGGAIGEATGKSPLRVVETPKPAGQ